MAGNSKGRVPVSSPSWQVKPRGGIAFAGFNPGAEEYNDQREAGRLGFTPSPGPRIRQSFISPPLKDLPKIKHASEEI